MKLSQKLAIARAFQGEPIPAELARELQATIELNNSWDGTVSLTEGLLIVVKGGTFVVSDRFGFLCTTKSVDTLFTLLLLEPQNNLRYLLVPQAERQLEPYEVPPEAIDWSKAQTASTEPAPQLDAFRERARQLRDRMQLRRAEGIPGEGSYEDVHDGVARSVGLD